MIVRACDSWPPDPDAAATDRASSAVAGSNITEDVFVGVKQPLDGGSAKVQVEVEVFAQ